MSSEEFIPFSINLEKVVKTKDYLGATRLLASHFLNNQYMSVEDFLSDISDSDLRCFVDMIEDGDIEQFILISEMLAIGEGLDVADSDETIMQRTNTLIGFVTVESLARKKLVKVYRENMSFGDDFLNKVIVEKL